MSPASALLLFKLLLLALLANALTPTPAKSAWVPFTVHEGPGYQSPSSAISDGSGGTYVIRYDNTASLYVHHLLASDAVDTAWPAGGLFLGSSTSYPVMATDGSGGAIVAWSNDGDDLYAHRVIPGGSFDPTWPTGGVLVSAAPRTQIVTSIVSDGAGGAMIVWEDTRNNDYDVFAHRVLSTGVVDPAWPADGLAVAALTDDQIDPTVISDGSGGAITAWSDGRSGIDHDIYAQRVLPSGVVAPGWPAGGKLLCGAADDQVDPRLCSDLAGGAIVVWRDLRSIAEADIYAMRVRSTGLLGQGWQADGEIVCDATADQNLEGVVSDGAGGAIAVWTDSRAGDGFTDIYVQKINFNGSMAWTTDGVVVCAATQFQFNPSIATDGSGGAYITWLDDRHEAGGGETELYLHRVLSTGAPDPTWPVNGGRMTFEGLVHSGGPPPIAVHDSGNATVAWSDETASPGRLHAVNLNGTWTPRYVVNVAAAPSQGGTVAKSPSQSSYSPGSQVTLTASPAAQYGFVNWSGDASGSTNPLTLTVDADKSVTANFASYPANVTIAPAGAGTVTKSPDQSGYPPGTQVTLTATNSPFPFLGWSGDASGTSNPLVVTMDAPKNITANFAAYSVTVSASPTGSGSVARFPDQPAYSPGSEVTLEAAPANGYSFDHWSGDATGTDNPTTITVDGNEVVTAHFTLPPPSCGNWSIAGPIGPSAYIGVYGAWDPVRDQLVVFGGSTQSALANETWRLPMSGTPLWTQSAPAGPPSARYLGQMAYDPVRDRFLIFGGHVVSATGPPPRTNEVWSLTLSGTPTWTHVIPAGTPPNSRAGHTAIYDPLRDRLIVFGGRISNFTVLNDVWQLSLAGTPTWTQLAPTGTPPSPRNGHTAIYDPVRDRMLVFGGADATVWALSLAGTPAWSQLTVVGTPPNDLGVRAVYDPVRDRMICIGNTSDAAWVLAFKHQPLWSRFYPNNSPSIGPRNNPVAVYEPDQDLLLVHGGSSAADTPWRFDLSGGFDVDAGGNNGNVTTESCYPASSVATLIAAPTAGYKFNQWLGDASGNSNPLEVTMDGYKAILAEFVVSTVGVEEPVTADFALGSIHPNPSPGRVVVPYSTARRAPVRLGIFDVAGREVARLVDGQVEAGQHATEWDGAVNGVRVRSGLYFAKFVTPAGIRLKRFALIQ